MLIYAGETVTIVRGTPGGFDDYGDPVTSTSTDITVDGVKVAPRSSVEPTERGAEGVVTGWTLYAPAGTVAYFTDQVKVRGVLCRIDGEVAVWPSGVVINCSRA